MKGFAGTSYDEVPYMAASFSNTHPEIPAVTALLRGLDPAPLAGARILEVCAKRLSPRGIVYLSYNTFPGWHVSVMFRDMMMYRTRRIADAAERLREARGFMQFLATSARPADSLWAQMLQAEAAYVADATDWYLLHDDLERENNPVYFSEMVERTAQHGLQYVTEERRGTADEILSPETWEILDRFAKDRVEREQYLDFIRSCAPSSTSCTSDGPGRSTSPGRRTSSARPFAARRAAPRRPGRSSAGCSTRRSSLSSSRRTSPTPPSAPRCPRGPSCRGSRGTRQGAPSS